MTATAYSPGTGGTGPSMDQIVVTPRLGLLAVADAPGGGDDGRAGARLALELVRSHIERNEDVLQRFRRNPGPELRHRVLTVIEEGFARAAQDLFAFARRRQGVLVTLDVLLLLDTEAFIGHVGDGRVYLVRRGLVHQLTVDHSRGDEAIEFEEPGTEEREAEPVGDRRYTRSLGPQPRVRVESLCMELASADRFVVCAAAMHRSLPDSILHARLISERLDALGQSLVSDAVGSPVLAACAQLGGGDPFTPDSAQARLAILAPVPLFAHLTERELRSVAQSTHPRRLPAGSVIFEEGHAGTELYLVISGSVNIVKHGRVIANLGPGSNFGEMALLDEPTRSATAVTAEDAELMVISRDAFFALLKGNPLLAVKILWNLTLRLSANLRTTSSRLAELERR
ncbi:MAG: cyclic nucleotide-binding domain-containing protein [Myxococcales bacterium]|nr:cyclic nucleotide-binding domain-containing protein [Myxococcales bacterium]